MAQQSNYFKVGLFLLVGLVMITAAAIVFGIGQYFKATIPAESYFDYSVEGLETGSRVSYEGVEIGTVQSVGFVAEAYPQASGPIQRYVLVRMKLYEQKVKGFFAGKGLDFQKEVNQGLRVRLALLGITGVPYLQMEYVNPERNPVPRFSWKPKTIYIPSAPTTLGRLEAMLSEFSGSVKKMELGELADSLKALVAELRTLIAGADVTGIGEQLREDLVQIGNLTSRLNAIAGQAQDMKVIPNMAATARNAAATTERLRDDLMAAAKNIRSASEVLSALFSGTALKEAVGQVPQTMKDISRAAAEISRGADEITATAENLNQLTRNQSQQIETLLENLNQAARDFRELAEKLRRNPSQLFLGKPPRSPLK